MNIVRLVLLVILIHGIGLAPGYGQVGDLFLSHHRPDGEGLDNLNFDLAVNEGGLLYIANRSGVLVYDGKSWDFHLTPSAALSIAVAGNGDIYVGCVDDYGKIELVGDAYQFVSLADTSVSHLVFETIILDQSVYFVGEHRVAVFDTEKSSSKIIDLPKSDEIILNAYAFEGELHILSEDDQYTYTAEGNLTRSSLSSPDASPITFVVKHPREDKYLIGSEAQSVYVYSNGAFSELNGPSYLTKNDIIMMDGDWVTQDLFVLSSLEHGCMLFSQKQDSLIDIIDDGSGLPDNQVFDLVTDDAEGLWIAHEFGISRLAPVLPVRSFSNYPGLHGNLLAVAEFDSKMYFATSKGVYHLDSIEEYKNTVYYTVDKSSPRKPQTSKPVAASPKVTSSPTPASTSAIEEVPKEPQDEPEVVAPEEEKKKKGLFGRLKDKVLKKDKEDTVQQKAIQISEEEVPDKEEEKKGLFSFLKQDDETATTDEQDTTQTVTDNQPQSKKSKRRKNGIFSKLRIAFSADNGDNEADLQLSVDEEETGVFVGRPDKNVKYKRNVKRELISTNYEFSAIPGMQTKCKQFVNFEGQLLAVCNSGIYQIGDDDAELVIDLPARNLIVSKSGHQLIVNTINDQVMVFEHIDNIWAQVQEIDLLGDIILSLHQDEKGQTWAASPTSLYVIDSSYTQMLTTYSIPNQYIDNIKINEINSRIYLINNQGYFYVDEASGKVLSDSSYLKRIGTPIKHLQQPNGETWVYNGKIWFVINENGEVHEKEHLALFPDMTFIDQIGDSYWVINETRDAYKVDMVISDSLVFNSKMSIKEVRGTRGHIELTDDLVFDYDENYVTFELARPDYLGLLQVEYQYKMEGLSEAWSSWSTNNVVAFNFLPPGNYTLLVRSRDSFGRSLENAPITFKVKPPYWKTVWFGLLELLFFVMMFTFSIWLNRRKQEKYNLLTQILTIFTIVLVIEFLQSIASTTLSVESTPVVDFIINAVIAFVIFPLEHFLRLFMRDGTAAIPFFPGDRVWRKIGVIPKSPS